MRLSFLHVASLVASLCLVQGVPLSSTTPGLPPLLQNPYKQQQPISVPSATSTSTSIKDSYTLTAGPTSATKKCSARLASSSSSSSKTTSSSSTAAPTSSVTSPNSQVPSANISKSCFPAIGFKMPDDVPKTLDGWWCNEETEYAFMGFSYDISACQSQSTLNREFLDTRKTFNSRYIRLYGTCDDAGYYDKVITAAWNAGLGVQALIWFGFDGDDSWKARKTELFKSLTTNPKAPFVTRGVQFGSEPLFDWAIDPKVLAKQVTLAKQALEKQQVPISVSDLAWGFSSRMDDGAQDVIDAVDYVGLSMLPYYAPNAKTGSSAWPNNIYDMNQMLGFTKSKKKILWTENGWPSSHYCPGQCPNSATAASSVKSEKAYYKLLDEQCTTMKTFPKGGVGWFAHIYSDNQQPGYGIYDYNGNLKFDFAPKTSC